MQKSNALKKTAISIAVAQALFIHTSFAGTITVNNDADANVNCTFREAIDVVNNGTQNPSNGCNVTGTIGTNDILNFSVASVTLANGQVIIEENVSLNPNSSSLSITSNNAQYATAIIARD